MHPVGAHTIGKRLMFLSHIDVSLSPPSTPSKSIKTYPSMRIKKEKEYNYLLAYLSLQVTVSSLSVRLGFYLLLCFWTLVMCQALRNHSTDTYGINEFRTPGQDGRVGPCRTKRRTTTNLKAKNNQNCQKIELYGLSLIHI